MRESRSIVVRYRPGQKYVLSIGLAVLLILTLFAGKFWGGRFFESEMREKGRLEELTVDQAEIIAEQKLQLRAAQLSSEVDAAALESARQEMIVLQKNVYQRDEQLKLYRELLQDSTQPDGLSVTDLKLSDSGGMISYRWVVRQKAAKMKTIEVLGEVWVIGSKGGRLVELSLADLDDTIVALPIKIKFKYFSINRGVIKLPEGFDPKQIRITLRYPNKGALEYDQKYDWSVEG